jgi:hypothetical protein
MLAKTENRVGLKGAGLSTKARRSSTAGSERSERPKRAAGAPSREPGGFQLTAVAVSLLAAPLKRRETL